MTEVRPPRVSVTTLLHCSDLHFGHPAVPEQYEAIEAMIDADKPDVVAISGDVSQRAREIGVRIALGAERRSILAMVLQRGLHLAFLGIVIGAALAVAAGRALQAVLAGVSPADVVTFGGAIGLAVLMTIVGSLLPALRATRVDPLQVIRSE